MSDPKTYMCDIDILCDAIVKTAKLKPWIMYSTYNRAIISCDIKYYWRYTYAQQFTAFREARKLLT